MAARASGGRAGGGSGRGGPPPPALRVPRLGPSPKHPPGAPGRCPYPPRSPETEKPGRPAGAQRPAAPAKTLTWPHTVRAARAAAEGGAAGRGGAAGGGAAGAGPRSFAHKEPPSRPPRPLIGREPGRGLRFKPRAGPGARVPARPRWPLGPRPRPPRPPAPRSPRAALVRLRRAPGGGAGKAEEDG